MAGRPGRPSKGRNLASVGATSGGGTSGGGSPGGGSPGGGSPGGGSPGGGSPGGGSSGGGTSADRFAALADGTRRHLLEQLAGQDRDVSELVTGLDISQAAVSQHLRVLRDAGLVTARKQGRHRYYRLQPAGLTELRDWLDELERFWQARLAALGDYLKEAPG